MDQSPLSSPSDSREPPFAAESPNWNQVDRRRFLGGATLLTGITAGRLLRAESPADRPEPLKPIGTAQGIHPGRVVWVHDPGVVRWNGPQDGVWWSGAHVSQDRVDAMLKEAVCHTAGEGDVKTAWNRIFAHLNRKRGRADRGYQPGEKIVIKPNWVGMIYRENIVDPQTYRFMRRENYMNTSPHMLLALLHQWIEELGVRPGDITICDTLAYLVHEYYDILHGAFPDVRYEDYTGQFGRIQVRSSEVPLYWSSRPDGAAQDYLPTCFAEADYLINFANFKAHSGAGVTLCAKNHFGSLIRWPVQEGYYNIHPNCFSNATAIYRPLVDLIGHTHLGGKTALYLIDGLFSGVHPKDPEPQRMHIPPMEEQWSCSLFASQDPVAIDSVAFDFLWAEGTPFPRKGGVDDYLHEAALADAPPSGTFYDPNHPEPTERLASLGVHEHWNDVREKRYSRNLGTGEGIELLPVAM